LNLKWLVKRDENKNSRAAPIGRLARLAQQRQRRSRLGRGRYYRPCAVVSADVVHGRLSTSGAGYGTALKVVRSGSIIGKLLAGGAGLPGFLLGGVGGGLHGGDAAGVGGQRRDPLGRRR